MFSALSRKRYFTVALNSAMRNQKQRTELKRPEMNKSVKCCHKNIKKKKNKIKETDQVRTHVFHNETTLHIKCFYFIKSE